MNHVMSWYQLGLHFLEVRYKDSVIAVALFGPSKLLYVIETHRESGAYITERCILIIMYVKVYLVSIEDSCAENAILSLLATHELSF